MAKLKRPRNHDMRKTAVKRLAEKFEHRSCAADDETDFFVAMEGQPEVTSCLKMASGGLQVVMEALRCFDDEDAQQFMEMYDSLTPTDRKRLKLEEIAVAADIGSSRLLGVATEALKSYGQNVSRIILGASLPKIVRKSVQMAMTPSGLSDRKMMLEAAAFVPRGQTSQIAIQQVNNPPATVDNPSALPPWDQEAQLRRIREAHGEMKGLPPASHSQPIPASVDTIQQRATEVLSQD
jgi:hypothetical protein